MKWTALFAVTASLNAYALCGMPAHQVLTYSLYAGGHHIGSITRDERISSSHYNISVDTKAGFLFYHDTIDEQSRGTVLNNTVHPKFYSLTDGKKGKLATIAFDWHSKRAFSTNKGKPRTFVLTNNAFDNLSYQLPLRCTLEKGKSTLSYSVITNGEMKTYSLKVLRAHDVINTSLGKLDTVQVEQNTHGSKDGTSILWFAKKYHYALVESEVLSKGKQQALATIKSINP